MAQVKASGNKSTELALLRILKGKGLKGWRRNSAIVGKPDFIFPKLKIALFIDGCFWHGCREHCRMPNSNQKYWVNKINKNKLRDKQVKKELKGKGWMVIRIWEHEIGKPPMIRKLKPIKEAPKK
jgi:DNA mismatch endonuclease (patch repair protein)